MPINYDAKGRIKRPGKIIEFDAAMLSNYAKCIQDIRFYAQNYFHIVHPVEGKQLITLRDYQLEILDGFYNNRFNILLAARQIGKTTMMCIYALWFVSYQKDKTVAIVANKASTAMSILKDIKDAYEDIPEYLKPGVIEWNKQTIEFDNGCKIIARATSPDCLRGESISLLLADEFAFVPQNICEPFWLSNYPTISTGGRCIIVSTPNGTGNLFYNIWLEAQKEDHPFNPMKVDWWQVPGRDDKWKQETIKTIGQIRFNQEFGNSFIGSTITLIDGDFIVKNLKSKEPKYIPNEFEKIWEPAIYGHTYAISCDIGGGVGSDYSVMNIFDVTNYIYGEPAKQVAIWRSNTVTPERLPEMLANAGKYWNNAYIIIEINPAGFGDDVQKELFNEYEYENLYFDVEKKDYGIYSTRGNKPKACQKFKKLLEEGRIILNDSQTINEIGYFEEVRENVYKAKNGSNLFDDCTMTCIWFGYFLESPYFQDEIQHNHSIKLKKENPEQYCTENNIDPNDSYSALKEEDTIDELEAFEKMMEYDSELNDPDSWLERDELDSYIRNHPNY